MKEVEEILLGGMFRPSEQNCPIRDGELIESLDKIYDIPNPRLGMRVYIQNTGKEYVVKSLKAKNINGVNVPNAAVDEFVEDVNFTTGDKMRLDAGGATNVVWENVINLSDMNDFTTAGTYNITGEHTRNNDNLPIENRGGGHTFSARLLVLDSSISGTGIDSDKCITQILSFSNRVGGDGNVYIRTARGASLDSLSWEKWATLQTNVNVGQVSSLNDFIDNGIYSGVYSYGGSFAETFVMVVINDYAIAGQNRSVAQFKYAYDTFNFITTFKHRLLRTGSSTDWTGWEEVAGAGNKETDITDAIMAESLPALVKRGVIKEGVTYMATLNMSLLNKLDSNLKIHRHLENADGGYGGMDSEYIISIKIMGNRIVLDIYEQGDANAYLHYYRYIMDTSCTNVKVSADMVTL